MEQIILFLEKRLDVLKEMQTIFFKDKKNSLVCKSLFHGYTFSIQEIEYILYYIKNDEADKAIKQLNEHLKRNE